MEARMDDEIMSMMRALLEAQERGVAYAHGMDPSDGNYAHGVQSGYGAGHNTWEPTGHHGFDRSYTYQGEPYAHEHHSGYDAGYQSWEPPSNQGFAGSAYYQGGIYDQANQSGFDAGYHSWQPTSSHGFAPSSDYQGGLYAPEHQSGYEEAYPPWDMQYDLGETTSSTLSTSDDTYNMMKMLLEAQTRSIELINSFDFGKPSLPPSTSAAATEHMESFTTDIHQLNDKPDSDCISLHDTRPGAIPPIDMGGSSEEPAQLKDKFLQEAEWTVTKFEFLLGCTVDENLVLSYEDQVARVVCEDACHGGLVVDCKMNACESSIVLHALPPMEVIHMPPVYKLENKERRTEVASTPGHDIGTPLRHPSPKAPLHEIGSLPQNTTRITHPWRLPFEEVRMKEFGGRFYDEYDPGDPRFRRVHIDTSS